MKPLRRILSAILVLSLGVPAPVWALRDPQTREKDPTVPAGLEEALRSGNPDQFLQTVHQAFPPIAPGSPLAPGAGMEELSEGEQSLVTRYQGILREPKVALAIRESFGRNGTIQPGDTWAVAEAGPGGLAKEPFIQLIYPMQGQPALLVTLGYISLPVILQGGVGKPASLKSEVSIETTPKPLSLPAFLKSLGIALEKAAAGMDPFQTEPGGFVYKEDDGTYRVVRKDHKKLLLIRAADKAPIGLSSFPDLARLPKEGRIVPVLSYHVHPVTPDVDEMDHLSAQDVESWSALLADAQASGKQLLLPELILDDLGYAKLYVPRLTVDWSDFRVREMLTLREWYREHLVEGGYSSKEQFRRHVQQWDQMLQPFFIIAPVEPMGKESGPAVSPEGEAWKVGDRIRMKMMFGEEIKTIDRIQGERVHFEGESEGIWTDVRLLDRHLHLPPGAGMEEAVRAVPLGNRVVVVEMGGTRIRAGLADNRSGELLGPVESRTIHFHEGIPKTDSRNAPVVLEQLNDLIDTVLRRYGVARSEVGAISFSSAGILDQQTGFIELQSNLPFTGMNLREEVRTRWGGEALITNDVAAAALAEALYGTGQGGPVVVYLTISTGLNAGLYLREQKRVMDLRFGRLLAYDGQPITEYASGRAIKGRASEAIARREPGWEEIVALAGGDAGAVDVPHVTDAWLEGNNPLASAILEDAVRVLGEGVVQATGQIEANGWLSGDRTVLWVYGGGIGEGLGDFFEGRFRQAVAAALKHPDRKGQQSKIQVIRSVMDPDKRGLMGAAARSLAAAWLEDKPVAEWRRKVAIPQRVLAIEMGGTKLRMAIADRRTGEVAASVPDWSWQFLPDLPHNDPRNRPEILRQIRQHADRLADQEGLGSISEAGLVSIDSPGVIQTDPKASDYGWVKLQYNLPFQGTNQLREIMTVLGFAAGRGLIENDMPAAIMAEAFYGGLQGRRLGFYLTASGGTNAAVFWQGADDKARTFNLELGGYPVPEKGPEAKVQDFTSSPSLARMARERILAERTQGGASWRGSRIVELATGSPIGSVEAVNEGRTVGQAFAEGDPLAAAVLQEAAGIQAKAIVQAVQEAIRQGIPLPEDEPEILWVLGGGVNEGLKGTGYVAQIQEAVNKEVAQANLPKPIVLKVSEMDGARRGLQGATAIARALAGMEEAVRKEAIAILGSARIRSGKWGRELLPHLDEAMKEKLIDDPAAFLREGTARAAAVATLKTGDQNKLRDDVQKAVQMAETEVGRRQKEAQHLEGQRKYLQHQAERLQSEARVAWIQETFLPVFERLLDSDFEDFSELRQLGRDAVLKVEAQDWETVVGEAEALAKEISASPPSLAMSPYYPLIGLLNDRWFAKRWSLVVFESSPAKALAEAEWIPNFAIGQLARPPQRYELAGRAIPVYIIHSVFPKEKRAPFVARFWAPPGAILIAMGSLRSLASGLGDYGQQFRDMSDEKFVELVGLSPDLRGPLSDFIERVPRRHGTPERLAEMLVGWALSEELRHALDSVRVAGSSEKEWFWSGDTTEYGFTFVRTQTAPSGNLEVLRAEALRNTTLAWVFVELSGQLTRAAVSPDPHLVLLNWLDKGYLHARAAETSLPKPPSYQLAHYNAVPAYAVRLLASQLKEEGIPLPEPDFLIGEKFEGEQFARVVLALAELPPERLRLALKVVYAREFVHPVDEPPFPGIGPDGALLQRPPVAPPPSPLASDSTNPGAGMEEGRLAADGARELWEGMRSRSAAPELKRVVIGRSVVDRFPAIAALAGLEEGRFLVDEGAATVVRLIGEGAEAVRYYGGLEEGRRFAAMAEEARLRVETQLPTAPEFLAQLQEILTLAGVPGEVVAAGLEQFADYLEAVPVGA